MSAFFRQTYRDSSGVTLLEMTFVLIVVGIMLGFGTVAWQSMKSSQKISAAKTILRTEELCLKNFVLHSETVPPTSYFTSRCNSNDPWGNELIYENSGDSDSIKAITPRILRDEFGDHPDAAWILVSFGPNGTRDFTSSPTMWDCSTGDDICRTTTRNGLLNEISQ